MANTLKLEIVTPEERCTPKTWRWSRCRAWPARWGFYPQHVPLMTQMVPGEMIVRKDGRDLFVATGEGLIEVTATVSPS